MGPPRLRIQLDRSLYQCVPSFENVQKIWWQPSKALQTVGEVLNELTQHLGAADLLSSRLLAELDGFALLHGSSASLLRDGDLLTLKLGPQKRSAEGEAAWQPAAKKQRRAAGVPPAVQQVEGQQGGQESSITSTSTSGESSSEAEEEGEQQQQARERDSPGAKSERFYTPAAKLGKESQQGKEGGGPGTAEGKRPSRSSRRKAAKRRLRREGILPPNTGKRKQRQQQPKAGGAGADAPDAGDGGMVGAATAAPAAKDYVKKQQQRRPGSSDQAQAAGGVGPGATVAEAAAALIPDSAMQRGLKRPGAGKASKGGGLLLPSGLRAKRISQDGHVHFAGSSSEEEEEEGQRVHPGRGAPAGSSPVPAAKAAHQGRVEVALPERRAKAVLNVPEVALSPRWLAATADGSLGESAWEEGLAGQGLVEREAARPAVQPPMPEEKFTQLPAVQGAPAAGSVVAYKLLEIGPDLAPQVSEVRLGQVMELDIADSTLKLAPYPDASLHPLEWAWMAMRAKRAAAAAALGEGGLEDEDEDGEEEEEQDLGAYEEDGTLHCELSSFVEMRLLHTSPDAPTQGAADQLGAALGRGPTVQQQAAGVGAARAGQAAGAAAVEDVGPSSYSQLGPPRPTVAGGGAASSQGPSLIPPEGGWASLYQQLQKRRAELAQQQAAAQQLVSAQGGGAEGCSDAQGSSQQQSQPGSSSRGGTRKGAVAFTSASSGGAAKAVAMPQSNASAGRATAAAAGQALAVEQQGQGSSLSGGGKRPQGAKPRGGVRASALGPILRMLRSSNELE